MVVRLSGGLDVAALGRRWRDVVARHEVLRTVYPETAEGPVQVVLPVGEAVPDVSPVVGGGGGVGGGAVTAFVSRPFRCDGGGSGSGCGCSRCRAAEFVLAVVVHHISGDGSSMGPLARDVMMAYAARVRGRCRGGRRCRCSMRIMRCGSGRCWGRRTIRSRWWRGRWGIGGRQLAGLPEQLDLPADRPRPAVQSFAGCAGAGSWSMRGCMRGWCGLAREHNATLFMVVHAALAVLLARLSGSPRCGGGDAVRGAG